jgi:hypothetical protein
METIRVQHLSPGIRCPSFTDRGLRLVSPAASPLGGYPKGKSLSPAWKAWLSLDCISRFGVSSRKKRGSARQLA